MAGHPEPLRAMTPTLVALDRLPAWAVPAALAAILGALALADLWRNIAAARRHAAHPTGHTEGFRVVVLAGDAASPPRVALAPAEATIGAAPSDSACGAIQGRKSPPSAPPPRLRLWDELEAGRRDPGPSIAAMRADQWRRAWFAGRADEPRRPAA